MAEPETTVDQVASRVLFENDRVRVWALALAAGGTIGRHPHYLDCFFAVVEPGAVRLERPNKEPRSYNLSDGQIGFFLADAADVSSAYRKLRGLIEPKGRR